MPRVNSGLSNPFELAEICFRMITSQLKKGESDQYSAKSECCCCLKIEWNLLCVKVRSYGCVSSAPDRLPSWLILIERSWTWAMSYKHICSRGYVIPVFGTTVSHCLGGWTPQNSVVWGSWVWTESCSDSLGSRGLHLSLFSELLCLFVLVLNHSE